MNIDEPTPAQLEALRDFAERHGRYWKRALRDAWWDGFDPREPSAGLLQQLRNEFGPRWLVEFRLEKGQK